MSEVVRSCEAKKTAFDDAEIPCEAGNPAIEGKGAPRRARQSECVSHGENCGLIKLATKRGGYRPGAGRKPSIPIRPATGPRWYCATVAYQHELLVLRDLLDLGFEAHCPLVVEDDQLIRRIAYPGYVFVRFDVTDPAWGKIDEPPRCRLMAEADGTPTPVSRGYVEGLLAAADGSGYIDARPDAASGLSAGVTVRITEGPYASFESTVIRTTRKLVVVSLTMFGRTIEVPLPRSAVEPR